MIKNKHSPGFSLILSLTVMAGLVMLIVTVSAFITIESRAAMNQQLATRARLNGIVAMRLALAHLQQEAGPDRRSTARAEITQSNIPPDKTINPMWTGVWRSDRPDAPPAWLVSGRDDQDTGAQSVSLSGLSDYPVTTWTPWQTDYDPNTWSNEEKGVRLIPLVGNGSGSPAEAAQSGQPWTAKPSGLVSLPKLPLPDDYIIGKYAYWVGDEGIKARPNIPDPRAATANSIDNQLALRSPLTHGLLKDLPNQAQLSYLSRIKDAPMLTGFNATVTNAATIDLRRYYHDVTTVSAGVLADSNNGGLKRDLSTAFEMSDDAFAVSEFGNSTAGAATMTESGYKSVQMFVQFGGDMVPTAPVYSRPNTSSNGGVVLGPTWWALRDYHRLYKQLGWSSGQPTLRARASYPNAREMYPNKADGGDPGNIRNEIPVYSDVFAGDQPTTLNPNVNDTLSPSPIASPIIVSVPGPGPGPGPGPSPPKPKTGNNAIPRPTSIAVTPYIQRVSLVFSVNIEYYTGGGADIWLNLTPIVVVHNPYNVAMTWKDSAVSASSAARYAGISFTDWQQWNFRFTRYTRNGSGPKYVFNVPLSKFYGEQSEAASNKDMFRVYFPPDLTLQPGEYRVLSCPSVDNTGKKVGMVSWKQATTLVNGFNQTGGFKDENLDWGTDSPFVLWKADDSFGFQIIPGGDFRARYALSCWPGDEMIDNNGNSQNTFAHYFKTSEHSELVYRSLDSARIGAPPELYFWDYSYIAYRTSGAYSGVGNPMPPNIIGVFDYFAKSGDTTKNGHPLFTHTNPLAPVLRADGAGRAPGSGLGLIGPSPSFAARYWRPTGLPSVQWPQVIQSVSGLTYGGYSSSSAGNTRAILTEVPLAQPVSLGQYVHANLTVRDQQPLLSVGNSFASHLVKSNALVQDQEDMANWTDFDHTYLINEALWDGFFLSSLAPRMDRSKAANPWSPTPSNILGTSGNPTVPEELSDLDTVIDGVASGSSLLDNPRFTVIQEKAGDGSTKRALADYRKSATVLLNQGAFNVNSTSFTAWQCFLGSAKKFEIGASLSASSPSLTENARFPRTLQTQPMDVASGTNLQNPTNWTGFANLRDSQIDALAAAIVAENKARFSQTVRTLKTRTPAARIFRGMPVGSKPSTPYLSLSEFINRFVSDDTWSSRCGALQSAIFRADKTTSGTGSPSGFSDRLNGLPSGVKLTKRTFDTTSGPDPTYASNAENIEAIAQGDTLTRIHTMMAAPGNLLQSDLLQALGSAIATRSDTFTIRCYGEATQNNGETACVWMEAIVQRMPDFLDSTDPAEATTGLTPVNALLGRRFKILSTRILKSDEV
jgi:hypothetical protein